MGQRAPTTFTQAKPPSIDEKFGQESKATLKLTPQKGSSTYYKYFSQRVSEHDNDTWVKIYLPLLKEKADGYVRMPGSTKVQKQMSHDIKHNGIPLTMRG